MALHEKNVPFESKSVDLFKGEHLQPWFLALNAKGEVPVLKDDMKIIPDSARIIDYLEDNFSNGNVNCTYIGMYRVHVDGDFFFLRGHPKTDSDEPGRGRKAKCEQIPALNRRSAGWFVNDWGHASSAFTQKHESTV